MGALKDIGTATIYSPKDYDLAATLTDLVEIVAKAAEAGA